MESLVDNISICTEVKNMYKVCDIAFSKKDLFITQSLPYLSFRR